VEPSRQTFGLLPEGTDVLMYIVFTPFAIVFVVGLFQRFRGSAIAQLVVAGPGGVRGGVKRLLTMGLMQDRVRRRPRGWPHLCIFYGFLTLLTGTTIVAVDWDLMRPMGRRLLVGTTYLRLEAILDAMGLVFVVGLAVALTWRLIRWRNTSADQSRVQWQFVLFIAGLLYLGTTGFVLEGLRLTLRPVPWAEWSFVGEGVAALLRPWVSTEAATLVYLALWWSHAIVAFSLIAAIPYTVSLHTLAAPLNMLAHPGVPARELSTPFDLREVEASGNFDVKAGASTLIDLTKAQRLALLACTNCGRCESVCPAVSSGTALSPRNLVQALRREQMTARDDKMLIESGVISSEALWACPTCGACVQECPVLIRPVDYIIPFRRELVAQQKIDKRQNELIGNLSRSGNPYGLPALNRTQLADDLAQLQRSGA